MSACPSCGADNRAGQKFCGECGATLARTCAACGTSNAPGQKFCGECGAPLGIEATAAATVQAPEPAVERRLVSVLFADLVGFTTLSESRDAEDTRELLSQYFATCRQLVERYGGRVEKFIGDAVMALWGAPVAQEDDAERAVRTALDLVAAVEELGRSVGAPGLRARAGVLTGEAAVTLGAEGEGMVAGDLVNTAARIQSAAEAGTVFVGEATKRATEAAIAYESAGTFELKGKSEPVHLSHALRVTAARGGALKSVGLESPFIGRDRELRLVKELFHASAEERKAHLVSIVGIAGIGKSRLAWEFEKYVDGLAETMFWWRGRCLAYGEGVAFWALAEMVRTRADITEREAPATARAKLAAGIEPYIDDPGERAWIEPRLAHLLGLGDEGTYERQDLFGAWRLYFERLADHQPAVLVFEDLQWADESLLEFIEYLLEWSRSHPIYIVTLARPELSERAPTWGAGRRNFSALFLDALPEQAMEQLLTSFVPGLPDDLRTQILARAEGVPLYAVETVRMLLDRGLVEEVDGAYRPTGTIDALEVPETLHALVAARLDGLAPEERRLLQNAAVLGKTFTRDAIGALCADMELEGVLQALVRKEVLSIQLDPQSPERGQYGFLQDLLRQVAYETLPKRERKAKHLAAAAHLESAFAGSEQEIVEVLAAHQVAAYNLESDAEDAAVLRERACGLLAEAARRSGSLGATGEAQRYFEQAAQLAVGPIVEAELLEKAGTMATRAARGGEARAHFTRAIELLTAEGDVRGAARISGRLGTVDIMENRHSEAIERMEAAFAQLADERDETLGALGAMLGRAHMLNGSTDVALERLETAIEIAETLALDELLCEALNTKGSVLQFRDRTNEGRALEEYALTLALERDLPTSAIRTYNNLAELLACADRHDEAFAMQEKGLALARRIGDRLWEHFLLGGTASVLTASGRWDEAAALASELASTDAAQSVREAHSEVVFVAQVHAHRGELDAARALLRAYEFMAESEDLQSRGLFNAALAVVCLAERRPKEALRAAEGVFTLQADLGWRHQSLTTGMAAVLEAALSLGEEAKAEETLARLDAIPPGMRNPALEGHRLLFRVLLQARRGEHAGLERLFAAAARSYGDGGLRFWLARCRLEHAEWLVAEGRATEAEPLLADARAVFAALRAEPWLERADRAAPEASRTTA